jgi:hypothetical protein
MRWGFFFGQNKVRKRERYEGCDKKKGGKGTKTKARYVSEEHVASIFRAEE